MSNIFVKYLNIPMLNFFFYCKHNYVFFFSRVFTKESVRHSRPSHPVFKRFVKSSFRFLSWVKVRVLYYANNWIYTTNHKRIAVNYFWFVILSGIFGMALATVIRLELAYPGVGIFAGDSLQYLSLATAHGVIMVFFMIIPLLSGAFANFLLPTQLGVHDVAFPRLNSAAFWFLPGGLIMLGQLICLDRRYQRMNCFNIREVQSLLKRRFFVDLINSNDHHDLLDQTMLGLRFKTNNLNSLSSHVMLHNNFGLTPTAKARFTVSTESDKIGLLSSLKSNTHFFSAIEGFSFKSNFISISPSYLFNCFSSFSLQFTVNTFHNYSIYNNFFYFVNKFFGPIFLIFGWFFNLLYNSFSLFFSARFLIKPLLSFIMSNIVSVFNFASQTTYSSTRWFSPLLLFITTKLSLLLEQFSSQYWLSSTLGALFSFLRNVLSSDKTHLQNINFEIKQSSYLNPSDSIALTWAQWLEVGISKFTSPQIFTFDGVFTNLRSSKDFWTNEFYNSHVVGLDSYFNNFYALKLSTYYKLDHSALVDSRFAKITAAQQPFSWIGWTNSTNSLAAYEYAMITFSILGETFLFISDNVKSTDDFIKLLHLNREFHSFLSIWYVPLLFNSNSFDSAAFLFQWHGTDLIVRAFKVASHHFGWFAFKNVSSSRFISFDPSIVNTFSPELLVSIPSILESFLRNCFSALKIVFSTLYYHSRKSFLSFKGFISSSDPRVVKRLKAQQAGITNSSLYAENLNLSHDVRYKNEENAGQRRGLRFDNPVFKYDYKSGDYFPKVSQETYTHLLSTIAGVTGGLRNAPWFLSLTANEAFSVNYSNFVQVTSDWNWKSGYNTYNWAETRLLNSHTFYNFFLVLDKDLKFNNMRWTSFDALNQKFVKMFAGSSMQQRIYSNWRQLKFTREAWRCKLLSARHQKNLFRRYVHENGVFFSIEKNARDLLPGWAMITPFSSRTRFTAIGKVDIGVSAILLVLVSSIISGVNFLVTYRYLSTLNNRKMRDARSFFTEGVMCSSWMMIAANPMLIIGLIMLLCDRHWQTSFFDYSGGGDTILFQHMFWFFGHPEVYIVVIPTFGFVNTLFSYYLKKRISARASLLYSIYTIAFLGFFVWGHHMYMVGLSHTTRMLFSTLTVMISVPAATKLMHWCVTLVNSSFTFELPFLFMLTYVFLFVSGGISGMCVAHTGMDVLFHDTFYVIGHFHVMFAGAAMFGSFGAFYFYFSAIFGVKYSRVYAYLHFTYYLLGQLLTVIPMFWLGYAGMPRRVLDYPSAFGGWHSVITAGHMLSVAGLISFFIMIFDSLRQSKAATRNNFGIMRYNTRLNFYLYEISRILFTQRKGSHLYRYFRPTAFKLNGCYYTNYEHLETTLFSYTFNRKIINKTLKS